jgi:hypothetical protein
MTIAGILGSSIWPLKVDCGIDDCNSFASVVEGNLVKPEDQLAKLRLVVEIADELWGT